MAKHRFWQGVRMRRVLARPDPDAPARLVTVPTAWDDGAADALAALTPGDGPVTLADAAEAWIAPLEGRGADVSLGDRLRGLLLRRQGAPGPVVWQGLAVDGAAPSYTLNLAAFHDPQAGFDLAAFAGAIETAALALSLARPDAAEVRVGMAGLAALLAALGIGYDSDAAREVAACLAALLRGMADRAIAGAGESREMPLPPIPARCAIPGLAELARRHARPPRPRLSGTVGIAAPGPAEALLGIETGGIAPPFSPLTPDLGLTATARLALAGQNLSAEAALARLYAGADPLAVPSLAAHAAMHDAVAPFMHAMPPRPLARPAPTTATRRDLPARRRGYTQRASVGGHRIYLSTGEYDDGQLGEITVTLPKDSPTVRGLMDSFAQAISLGLQHGVQLSAYVDAFAGTRFGPGGAVEEDAAVTRATSLVDYVMRSLAANYLGQHDLPIAEPEPEQTPAPAETAPLLPLDLPRERRLRLVSSRVGGREPG
jgi:hypothetical protein